MFVAVVAAYTFLLCDLFLKREAVNSRWDCLYVCVFLIISGQNDLFCPPLNEF